MVARDRETHVIAITNEEEPFIITYYIGTYRLHRQTTEKYWSLEVGKKVYEPGPRPGSDGYYGCRLTMEQAAYLIADDSDTLEWELQHEAIEKSGTRILTVVDAINKGIYEPSKKREPRHGSIKGPQINIQEVLVLKFKDEHKTITLQQGSNSISKFTLIIDSFQPNTSEKLTFDKQYASVIVEMLMRII